jgi:hypothetical protein
MNRAILKLFVLMLFCTLPAADIPSQQDKKIKPEEDSYGSNFFNQLINIFGKFRNSDLQNVFQEAHPIHCAELIGREGKWKQVAFFNEDRSLGDWCRTSLEEVKNDLTLFTFKGSCGEDGDAIQVATEFPTITGIRAYQQRKINLNQVDIKTNKPVNARMNPETQAYTFELPYLFLKNGGSRKFYSFNAPNLNSVYDREVTSRWECKAVFSKDTTYYFLICRISTVQKNARRNEMTHPTIGKNAFFILSDSAEAQTSVKITFGDEVREADKQEETTPSHNVPAHPIIKRGPNN